MSIPKPSVSDEDKSGLQLYLQTSGETVRDVAFCGPTGVKDKKLGNKFWLICAYELARTEPEDAFNYLHLANAFYVNGYLNEAIEVYRELEGKGATFLGYYDDPQFNIGIVQAELKHYAAAMEALAVVGTRFPKAESELAYYVATVYHAAKDFENAKRHYEKCLQRVGNSRQEKEARSKIESLLGDVGNHITFTGKVKSQWQEYIH